MKSESEFIMDSFTRRDILPPRELHFIAVAIYLWRRDDGMPCGIGRKLAKMMKCLVNLSLFDPQLILITDSEPLRATIHLESFRKRNFDGRFFYDIELLSFVVRFSLFQYPYIHDAARDTPS